MSTIKVNVIEPYSGSSVSIVGLSATASNAVWSGISGIPAGLVSGSYSSSMSTRITAQEDFSSSLDATFATDADVTDLSSSASTSRDALATDISTNANSISTLNGKTLVSSSISGDAQGQVKVNGVNVNITDLQTTSNPTFAALTASSALINNNLVVNGTASFAFLQSVTGSAKIIGDAFIQLNENTPSQRYAGLQVVDSGSTFSTASFFFDGLENNWMYEYEGDDTEYALALFGPEFGTKGSPVSLTENTVPLATGSHHLVDSNITDDGSTITLGSNTSITGTVVATGTTLVSGSAQVTSLLPSGVVSGSAQTIANLPAGTVSGSAQIDLGSATGTAANATSASFSTTASFALNAGGGLSAQTASTSLTMSANIAYVVTGTAAPITMSLPSSPNVGELIKFANMDDRATLLGRNGNNIMGLAEDMTLNVEQVSFDLVYVGPTAGWTIYGSRALS